ncbi:hypothetical protein SAMN06265380_11393 [Ruegeria faecimaris]|uniref:Uncharacterized protein n=1 Tax=Ruegeria faecimaris TaxID=686389 RepID=A0A521EUM9_9RHOB|nr:hypothetical protein SAMN06265380_11393 [Ruegeria faecimaris]
MVTVDLQNILDILKANNGPFLRFGQLGGIFTPVYTPGLFDFDLIELELRSERK